MKESSLQPPPTSPSSPSVSLPTPSFSSTLPVNPRCLLHKTARMPGLVSKLLIIAAVDGIILQPLAQKGQRSASATKIAYNDHHIGPVLKDGGESESESEGGAKSFEAFGIVG